MKIVFINGWSHWLISGLCVCGILSGAYADETSSEARIPDPLTLEAAMGFAEQSSSELMLSESKIRLAEAEQQGVDAETGLTAQLEGRLRYVEPNSSISNQSNDDHRAALTVQKTLYDFGRSKYRRAAADADLSSAKMDYQDTIQRRRIAIMRRFFDVILADMQFYRYNEEMAVEYIELDKLRDRKELGQVSDIEVLKQKVIYNRARYLRFKNQNLQRITRARLAIAMGRPGELVSTIAKPELPQIKLKLFELEILQTLAVKNNKQLQVLQHKLDAAQKRLQAARAGGRPIIRGEMGAYAYSRQFGFRDKFQAGIVLEVPLLTGGAVDADVAKQNASIYQYRAELRQLKDDIQQAVLERWFEFDGLRKKLDEIISQNNYSELYLDRSRALYEMEVAATLGDSMVQVSAAQRALLKTRYAMAVSLLELENLIGQSLAAINIQTEITNQVNTHGETTN